MQFLYPFAILCHLFVPHAPVAYPRSRTVSLPSRKSRKRERSLAVISKGNAPMGLSRIKPFSPRISRSLYPCLPTSVSRRNDQGTRLAFVDHLERFQSRAAPWDTTALIHGYSLPCRDWKRRSGWGSISRTRGSGFELLFSFFSPVELVFVQK